MRPVEKRLLWRIACFCLPTLAVVVGGVYFYIKSVPEIVKGEKDRVIEHYRNIALELQANPKSGKEIVRRKGEGPGWVLRRRMKPGYWGFVLPKGNVGKVIVWYEHNGHCIASEADMIPLADYLAMFWLFGVFAAFVLVGVTAFGVGYLVRYVRAREDFMAATAHDLTTPLVGLRCMIGRDDETAKILNERMIRLVDNIKDFLRLGGRRTPAKESVDLVKAYGEAYALFRDDYRDLFDDEDVELEVNGSPMATADATMTVQILWNLLCNDLKYAAPYGKVRVCITNGGDGFVRVEFIDFGNGLAPKEMAHVFDRYYRAKTVMESGKGGFGIGLCTAREFAEAMGGSLTVRANQPKGCVFTLALPGGEIRDTSDIS